MIRSLFYTLIPLAVLFAAITLACFLAYFISQCIGDQIPLRKIISKSTQFFLVMSIFPAMFILKINKTQLGFTERSVFFKQIIQGFGLGFITLLPVFVVLYLLGIIVFDETQFWTAALVTKKMLAALLFALVISLIEEPIFRGILLTGLNKKMPTIAAIVISSLYYAALHFLHSKTDIPYRDIHLFSGFTLLNDAFLNLINPEILSAFLALLMVGIFLGTLRTHANNSLGLCIGCHTCWVWQIKTSKNLFNNDFNSKYAYLVSHYDGVIGYLVTVWLLLAILSFWLYRSRAILSKVS
jgi:uncharacterized protein